MVCELNYYYSNFNFQNHAVFLPIFGLLLFLQKPDSVRVVGEHSGDVRDDTKPAMR